MTAQYTCYEDLKAYAEAAARLIGCNLEDLLAFRWCDDDQHFIALAPDGARHRFDVDQLEAAMAPPARAGSSRDVPDVGASRDSPTPQVTP